MRQRIDWWTYLPLGCQVKLRLGWGDGDNRGWGGWMASLTWWTWVWVNSGSWWWTRRPGVLQSMRLQRVGHDWVTELTDWLTDASYSSERSNEIRISVWLSPAVRSLLLVLTWIVSVEWYGQKPSCRAQSVCVWWGAGGKVKRLLPVQITLE